MKLSAWMLGLVLTLGAGAEAFAASPTCPSGGTFTGGVFTRLCKTCYLPIVIGPVPAGDRRNVPMDDLVPTCTCPGRIFGYPTPGLRAAMWQPTHALEMVRAPFCSPLLGGQLTSTQRAGAVARMRLQGGRGEAQLGDSGGLQGSAEQDHTSYYNMHYLMFPVGMITDLVKDAMCVSESGGTGIDVAYLSEIDPTWNNDELALFTHPEAVLFTSLPAVAACMADAVSSSVYQPIKPLFWCAGSWGHMYPFTGNSSQTEIARATSHGATRGLAALHRRLIAQKTYNGAAVCRDHPDPLFPKLQYRLQTFYPVPELERNHWVGASTFTWFGGQVAIPGVGEDFVYVKWEWQACCVNI
jgi:conjugal transfer pilus assembly protein TraU